MLPTVKFLPSRVRELEPVLMAASIVISSATSAEKVPESTVEFNTKFSDALIVRVPEPEFIEPELLSVTLPFVASKEIAPSFALVLI